MNQKVIPFILGFVIASCGRIAFHLIYWTAILASFGAGYYLHAVVK